MIFDIIINLAAEIAALTRFRENLPANVAVMVENEAKPLPAAPSVEMVITCPPACCPDYEVAVVADGQPRFGRKAPAKKRNKHWAKHASR